MTFILNESADNKNLKYYGFKLETSIKKLVKYIGKPHFIGGRDSQTEWLFSNDNNDSVCFHDWKNDYDFNQDINDSDKIVFRVNSKEIITSFNFLKWLTLDLFLGDI